MQGFPIELAYVLDPEIRRSDGVIAADALDFAASGFIDDIDTAAVPPPAPNATDVDVDFDDHAPPPPIPRPNHRMHRLDVRSSTCRHSPTNWTSIKNCSLSRLLHR